MTAGPPSTEISLMQRLEYISRAILSAKSSSTLSTQGADGEFLHQLEEKMEVGGAGGRSVGEGWSSGKGEIDCQPVEGLWV